MMAVLFSLLAAQTVAATPAVDRPEAGQVIRATDAELDAARGGFALANGMVINISIDRRVYQNGVETSASYFESPRDLALMQGGAPDLGAQFADNLLNAVIQNTMDNQLIEAISKIDVELYNPAAGAQELSGAGVFSQFLEPAFR